MKIVFILNSINDAHSQKRVSDFISQGIDVEVYGFLRSNEMSNTTSEDQVLGQFSNSLSYGQRLKIYYKGIKKLFKEKRAEKDILWFYLGLDVALIAVFLSRKNKYIYEECDLVQTYVSNNHVQSFLETADKIIIRRSLCTIMTSEGFLDFHYGSKKYPNNILIVPNKLMNDVDNFDVKQRTLDSKRIRFAFAGGIRYLSILKLADEITKNYPNHEFHFYGYISPTIAEEDIPQRENIFYHGRYKSPDDLNDIYSNVDVLICTYDTSNENVRYAEPNKLYEAIFFSCPIIASSGTFLADKIKRLKIGYDVDVNKEADIIELVKKIESEITNKTDYINNMDKNVALGNCEYVNTIINMSK